MNIKDTLSQEYKIGSRCYILSKSMLRCIDQSHAKNNFSLPLNKLDPNYSYGGTYSPLWLLFIGYLVLGIIARGVQWLYGSTLFDSAGNMQLIIFPIFLAFAAHQFYRDFKTIHNFRFCFLHDGTPAFSLPINKKNKTKTRDFLHAIVSGIYNETPTNEYVLFLLRQYGLLTNIESTQLDAYIQQNPSEMKSIGNVIQLTN